MAKTETGPAAEAETAGIPADCQLCRPHGKRGPDIKSPSHSVKIATADGDTKFIYACRTCIDEMGWSLQDITIDPLPARRFSGEADE